MYMFLLTFFFVMQWASILVNRSRIEKSNVKKRENYLRKSFYSMGLPSIIGLAFGFVCLIINLHWAIPVVTYIVLSVVFAFVGPKMCKSNNNKTKKK